MQFPSFHVLGNLFFIFFSMSPAFCPSPNILFTARLGFEFDMDIATSHPLLLRFGGMEESGPHVSDL